MILSPSSLTEIPTSSQTRDTVEMIALWITLLFLHRASTLVPVKTVQLGEPATFTCASPSNMFSSEGLNWYKQSIGDNLKLIVALRQSMTPEYGPKFSDSRFVVHSNNSFSNLTILRTNEEDEGIYHCAIRDWINTEWNGTYLMIKGNSQRTSHYTVIQQSTASDPVRPGDSVTLQCSVLSDSDTKTCPGGHSVFWVRAGSRTSHPDFIYTDGNRHDECERRSDSQRSCVYHLSKNISSSDAGTYYCAVVTCGQILFGNGSTLDIQGSSMWSQRVHAVDFLLCAVLAISLIVIAVLIYVIICYCKAAVSLQANCDGQKGQQKDEDMWVYSAVVFTVMKVDSGAVKSEKAAERKRIYTAVKTFGLD